MEAPLPTWRSLFTSSYYARRSSPFLRIRLVLSLTPFVLRFFQLQGRFPHSCSTVLPTYKRGRIPLSAQLSSCILLLSFTFLRFFFDERRHDAQGVGEFYKRHLDDLL